MILPFASNTNPRLQWATATSLGYLCTEFEPELEENFHNLIMPGLLTIIETNTYQKVQA